MNLCVLLRVAEIRQRLSSTNGVVAQLGKSCSVLELLEHLFLVELALLYQMERIQPVNYHLFVLFVDFMQLDFGHFSAGLIVRVQRCLLVG